MFIIDSHFCLQVCMTGVNTHQSYCHAHTRCVCTACRGLQPLRHGTQGHSVVPSVVSWLPSHVEEWVLFPPHSWLISCWISCPDSGGKSFPSVLYTSIRWGLLNQKVWHTCTHTWNVTYHSMCRQNPVSKSGLQTAELTQNVVNVQTYRS